MAQSSPLLPNLSGLKLKEEEQATDSVQAYRPSIPPGTSPEDYEDVYDEALFGYKALKAVAASIENNEVLASYQPSKMYETFPGGLAFHTVKWWFDWQYFATKTFIGGGTHNSAYLVPPSTSLPPDAMLSNPNGYNLPLTRPTKGMIVRIGKVITKGPNRKAPPTKAQHICEMITAAYAHSHGFGPIIYAQFYIGKAKDLLNFQMNATKDVSWDAPVPAFIAPGMLAGEIGMTKAHFTCTIAEAWEGDCSNKISSSPARVSEQFDPDIFAKEFVRLCVRAANSGFWHMDVKRANLLYRMGETDPDSIELTFTDFDSYFCRILAPHLRAQTRRCCIVATAACFLGEIRCQESKEAWLRFASPIREAMKTEAGVDIQAVNPKEWCFFLKNVGETREVTNPDGTISVMRGDASEHQWRIGNRFINHIYNYLQDNSEGNTDKRCFDLDSKKPLFPQVVDYAFVTRFS
tara:strand:- start:1270 stop:2658 length:1389 start_codon:yes stop_codon:yes gene_type:complete